MQSIGIRNVFDFGSRRVLRVISYDGATLMVETTGTLKDRLLTFELKTEEATHQAAAIASPTPTQFAGSGYRWAPFTHSMRNRVFDTNLTWQDTFNGATYTATIEREKTLSILCPPQGNLIYIGTKVSAENRGGRIRCFCQGRQLWEYELPHIEMYRGWKAEGLEPVKAFPYQMCCTGRGDRVFASFLRYLYVLDATGTLVCLHDSDLLVQGELHGSGPITSSTTVVEEVLIGGSLLLTTGIDLPLRYEHTTVSNLGSAKTRDVAVAAVENMLFWIAASGKIAHSKELDIGSRNELGNSGKITKLCLSNTGGIVAAVVACHGVSVIVDGTSVRSTREQLDGVNCLAISDERGIVALGQSTHVKLFDLHWNQLGLVNAGASVRSLAFSDDGRLLFTSGGANRLYALS